MLEPLTNYYDAGPWKLPETILIHLYFYTQAIALSLQDSAGSGVGHRPSQCSDAVNATVNERKGESQIQEDTGRRKRKKSVCYLQCKMLPLFPLCPYLIFPFAFL